MAMVMDIQGVPGESSGKGPSGKVNTDWDQKIQIETMGYDISQRPTQSAGTGLASGGATVGSMMISKVMDKSTPYLFYQLCSGEPYQTVTIRVTRAGAKDKTWDGLYEAETFILQNVIVSSYHTSGALSASGLPLESWSLSFIGISEKYQELTREGDKKPAQPMAFDFGRGMAT
jgi:type VI secretion system Hcp family effector